MLDQNPFPAELKLESIGIHPHARNPSECRGVLEVMVSFDVMEKDSAGGCIAERFEERMVFTREHFLRPDVEVEDVARKNDEITRARTRAEPSAKTEKDLVVRAAHVQVGKDMKLHALKIPRK